MKDILITGANGYIGARLSKYLSENGYNVTALCYPVAPTDESWLNLIYRVVVGDIRNEAILDKITSFNFDIIIHLVSLDHRQSVEFSFSNVLSINVLPIGNLLEKFSKKGLNKFIYFSTFQVYGDVENTLITEEYRTMPLNLYSLTHLQSEQICNYYNITTEIDCISVRLSNSFGSPVFFDNNCWWLVINELCKDAFLNQKIRLKSDGSPLRDFIHSSDLCKAIKILIDSNNVKNRGNIYNLASGNTLSILQLAFKVREIYENRFGRSIDVFLPNNILADYNLTLLKEKHFKIDITKLRSLGFGISSSTEEGINELFNYLETYYER